MAIKCAKLIKQNFIGLKVLEGTQNVYIYTFDLDLWCSNPAFAFCSCSCTGYQLCQDIFKKNSAVKMLERTQNVDFLTFDLKV
jgi:hypothetical protein